VKKGEIMKANISRRALGIFSTLVLFAALVASSVHAGSSGRVVFHVPFDFVAAGKTLPAGEYFIVRSTLDSQDILSLRRVDNNEGIYILTSTVRSNWAPKDSKLVFNRYEDQYFLAEFWNSGEESGRKVIKSDKERTLARDTEKAGAKPERVAIANRHSEK